MREDHNRIVNNIWDNVNNNEFKCVINYPTFYYLWNFKFITADDQESSLGEIQDLMMVVI